MFCISAIGFCDVSLLLFYSGDGKVQQFILVCFVDAALGIGVSLLCHFDAVVTWNQRWFAAVIAGGDRW